MKGGLKEEEEERDERGWVEGEERGGTKERANGGLR